MQKHLIQRYNQTRSENTTATHSLHPPPFQRYSGMEICSNISQDRGRALFCSSISQSCHCYLRRQNTLSINAKQNFKKGSLKRGKEEFSWKENRKGQVTELRLMDYFLCVHILSPFSHVRLSATPWPVARQAPLSMGFSRQEYRSRLPFSSPGDLPDPVLEPGSPAL